MMMLHGSAHSYIQPYSWQDLSHSRVGIHSAAVVELDYTMFTVQFSVLSSIY